VKVRVVQGGAFTGALVAAPPSLRSGYSVAPKNMQSVAPGLVRWEAASIL
jgi:hypothetical protein